MRRKDAAALLRMEADAEAWAFSVSVRFGRLWKSAYQEARRGHTIPKAIEIADAAANKVRAKWKNGK